MTPVKTKLSLFIFNSFIALFVSNAVMAQQKVIIDSTVPIEAKELRCLNKGENLPACVDTFYLEIDSMLNIVYKQLMQVLTPDERLALKKEELLWLKKRTVFFKAKDKEYETMMHSTKHQPYRDIALATLVKKGDFEEDRLIELLNRLRVR